MLTATQYAHDGVVVDADGAHHVMRGLGRSAGAVDKCALDVSRAAPDRARAGLDRRAAPAREVTWSAGWRTGSGSCAIAAPGRMLTWPTDVRVIARDPRALA